jgi:hypothetical protein
MGIEFGPMSFDDLAGLVERGNLRPSDPVRNSQAGAWIKASQVPGLVRVARQDFDSPRVSGVPSPGTSAAGSPAPDGLSGTKVEPAARGEPAPVGESASEPDLLSLRQYNCAILIGPDGVSLCDLRGCQQVAIAIAGARVIGHRSGEDDSPIRFGPFELEISIREVGELAAPTPHAGSSADGGSSEQGTVPVGTTRPAGQESIPIAAGTSRSRVAPRGASTGAETGDIAAEMLKRMFMPRPSGAR